MSPTLSPPDPGIQTIVTGIGQTSDEPRPFIIPIFLPNTGCPHQCVFCNQHVVTGENLPLPETEDLNRQVSQFLSYNQTSRHPIQIAFYGGNFLGIGSAAVKKLLDAAQCWVDSGNVDAIRFSTRPDSINERMLDVISGYAISTIEIGAQSMDDEVLALSERGHRAIDTNRAVALLKARTYTLGLQMMLGLPGDSEAGAMVTVSKIIALNPDFVRIYPTVVLKKSRLAQLYKKGRYAPMALDQAVSLAKKAFTSFKSKGISVIRMGLQLTDGDAFSEMILAGPYHPAFGQLVQSAILYDHIADRLSGMKPIPENIKIGVHFSNASSLRGQKNSNIQKLKKTFGLKTLRVFLDSSLAPGNVNIMPIYP